MSQLIGHIKRISGSILALVVFLGFLALTIIVIIYIWHHAPGLDGVSFGNLTLNILVKFLFSWGLIIILAVIGYAIVSEIKRYINELLGKGKSG